ncbi:hypothetical protein SCLCIDRAFT_446568 [Scleroderma citrinum Foug A]|uniref:DUF6534 domain-containing protein n=1 Tax=Scleroderma citrinum Foug A TaxID=1036808 RepID=A0A0C3EBJ9_9AGAM|nr:hypothetical protein SCLCIDRAFT_446568 [Scleroderma citrinum Foug A]
MVHETVHHRCPVSSVLSTVLLRSKMGWSPSDTVVQCLIHGAVQTGLFASIFALCDLICFLWLPSTLYAMFVISIDRIYSNGHCSTHCFSVKILS